MRIRTFIQKLNQNEITDFDEFLAFVYPMSFRRELVKRGIRVEDAIALNESEPILEAILQGYAPEKYAEWMTHPHDDVREALANAGYFPETYIHDEKKHVRIAVLKNHPEYVIRLLKNYDNYNAIHEHIIWSDQPDVNMLKTFIEAPKPAYCYDGYEDALEYKLLALTTAITPIEKTMTRRQLFESGSPLWVKGISAYCIKHILQFIEQAKHHGAYEAVLEKFDEIATPETFHTVSRQIEIKYHFSHY